MRLFVGIVVSLLGLSIGLSQALAVPSEFKWERMPVQSGEIANIVVSPSDPDVMYLGVEVNAHSAYKSTDRGKSWTRILSYDHAKDVVVHPTNPDIAFLADSQQVWRTTTGGAGIPRVGEGARNAEGLPPSFEKVLENDSEAGPAETSFSAIAYAPSNPSVWYVGTRGSRTGGNDSGSGIRGDRTPRLWRSSDSGQTWTKVSGTYPVILVLAVDPTNENRLLIGSEEGIFASSDGGATVRELTRADHVAGIVTSDGQTWLAASLEGIYRSTDGAATWQLITDNLPDRQVLRVAIVRDEPTIAWATTSNGVARSTDGGQTWTNVSSDLPAKNLQALAVDPTNPNLAIVATETHVFSVRSEFRLFRQGQYYRQGIYRTEDGGKHWTRSDAGLIEENLIDITTHPTRPYEVWVSQQASRGLYRSRDAGQTWSLSPHLLTHYPMRTVFFPDDPDHLAHTSLHIGEDFGISTDSGVSWDIQSQETFFEVLKRGRGNELFNAGRTRGGNLHLHGLAIDPANPKVIYVGSVDDPSQFNQKPVSGAHLFKSTDGGKTWAESDEGYDHSVATSINDIKIDPVNRKVLYLGTTKKESTQGNGLWKSSDAGATWARANSGMPDDTSVSTIVIHRERTDELLAATYAGLYRSNDGGATWERVMAGMFKDIEADPANPDVVYAGSGYEGQPGMGPSVDRGKEGMFVSRDFGQTWTDITGDLPTGKVATVSVSADGTIVYAGIEGHGLFRAVDSAVGTIALDAGKTELGDPLRGGPRAQHEGGHSGPFGLQPGQDPFGGEPPTWFKAVMLGGGVTILALVGLVIWRWRRRQRGGV